MGTPTTRKSVNDLSAQDFDAFAVWEYALDEEGEADQDETTVRPVHFEGELDPCEGMFVVRARFILADGTVMKGYVTPSAEVASDLGTLQPAILTPHGQVLFWYGTLAPNSNAIAENYSWLGKDSAAEVFPISFESDVPLIGGPIRGELPGFLALEDVASMRTRVLK